MATKLFDTLIRLDTLYITEYTDDENAKELIKTIEGVSSVYSSNKMYSVWVDPRYRMLDIVFDLCKIFSNDNKVVAIEY